jgi:hypothetical protein
MSSMTSESLRLPCNLALSGLRAADHPRGARLRHADRRVAMPRSRHGDAGNEGGFPGKGLDELSDKAKVASL